MFIAGYVYASNPSRPGFSPEPAFHTEKQAQEWIETKLAGKNVTFRESDNKFRAFADGDSTGYIYFEVVKDSWALVDINGLGYKGKSAVKGVGPLDVMKDKARTIITKDLKARSLTVKTVNFVKTGDNIGVDFNTTNEPGYDRTSGLSLIRV
jgi:hypothetical protein